MSKLFLEENYELKKEIDMKKSKKLSIGLTIASLIIMIVALILCFIIRNIFNQKLDLILDILQLFVLLVSMIFYIIFHELTHALVMKFVLPKEKLNFGLTLTVAYVGMKKAYFSKKHYILISLAPVVVWGIIFTILLIITKDSTWFIVVALLQALNLSGAVGDYYCTYLTIKSTKDVLVNDDGASMRFYEIKKD